MIPMPPPAVTLVRRYYIYSGIYTLAASVIWGVNTLFLLDAGLSISEVFIANSAWSLGTVLFEIPTGVVADTVGRRTSFLLSLVVLAASTAGYVWLAAVGAGVVAFSIVSVLIGLGFTFYSGAMEAWLVDGLVAEGYDGDLDRVFGRGQLVSGAAMLTGTVGGGLLGQLDLAFPFIVRTGLLLALLVLAFRGMFDLGFTPRPITWRSVPRQASEVARAGIRFGWSLPSLRLLMVAGFFQMGVFAWAWYAWQPYLLDLLQRDAVWVAGVVAALLALSMMAGNGIVEMIARRCARRSTIFLGAGALFSGALVGVGLATSFAFALAMLLLAGIALGVQTPVRQAFVHKVVPAQQRATVISFDAMITGGGSVGGQTGLGAFSERRGYSAGYVLCGLITILALPFFWMVRKAGSEGDRIVGTSPKSSCATPAIPAISHIDNEAVGAVDR